LCTLNVWNLRFHGEIEYPKFRKFSEKLPALYMCGISGFVEKLNILKYTNSMGDYVYYTYGMWGFADKLKIRNSLNLTGNSVH